MRALGLSGEHAARSCLPQRPHHEREEDERGEEGNVVGVVPVHAGATAKRSAMAGASLFSCDSVHEDAATIPPAVF